MTLMGLEIYALVGTNIWHHNQFAKGCKIFVTRENLHIVQIITIILIISYSMDIRVHLCVSYHQK